MTPSILPLRVREVGYTAGGRELLSDISFDLDSLRRTVILGPMAQARVSCCESVTDSFSPRAERFAGKPLFTRRGAARRWCFNDL